MKYALALLALTTVAHCQIQPELVTSSSYGAYLDQMLPLPDAPSSVSMLSQSRSVVSTTGLSRSDKLAIVANVGLRLGDAAQTCLALHNGGREYMLPTQNCGANAAFILAGIPAQYYGMKFARRYGHPWIAEAVKWGLPAGSAIAIGYSTYHWNDPLRRKP